MLRHYHLFLGFLLVINSGVKQHISRLFSFLISTKAILQDLLLFYLVDLGIVVDIPLLLLVVKDVGKVMARLSSPLMNYHGEQTVVVAILVVEFYFDVLFSLPYSLA